MMTEQEKQWFNALMQDRSESADTLEKPSMRGVQRSVVDKYSDQAHFIYELLQNADDVKATTATFRLEESGLYFTHNGSVRFTVSNPQNEEADTNNGTLGHINAITSIANSNKTEASIGKFGVGFKAVFQYTQTPHIYDPEIRFKVERFIVPHSLDTDLDSRNPSETVFFFPFDHKEKQPRESHDEILEKLKALEFPVLFLSSLKSVSFEADEVTGTYTKEVTREIEQGGITVQWITLALVVNDTRTAQHLLVFTRNSGNGHPCSIGYAFDKDEKLAPIARPAFCFFPTKEVTNLNFTLHAPFLLTDSREGIKAGEKHNNELIEQLAELAANSLPILRDKKLIDDGILDIIPYDEARVSELFKPFFTTINSKLQTEALLPSRDNQFAESKNAYWASVPRIAQLISNEQLVQITNNKDARWVFTSFGRDECLRKNKEIAVYIDKVICTSLDEKDILTGRKYDGGKSFDGISAGFIKQQPHDWLFNFYQWLSETKTRTDIIKDRKIFIDSAGNAIASHDQSGKLILFLPDNDGDGYATLSSELFSTVEKIIDSKRNQTANEFFERFGIREHTVKDEIESAIEKMKKSEIPADNFLIKSFKYFKDECPQNEIEKFILKIQSLAFLPYETKNGKVGFSSGQGLYFPTPRLVSFYALRLETKFVAWETLRAKHPESDHETLKNFLDKLGVNSQEPSKRDEVYNIILPQWRQNQRPDNNTVDEGLVHFKAFLDYFTSLSQYVGDAFLGEIRELPFLLYSTKQDSEKKCFWGKAADIYLPTDDLKVWFETKPDTKFLLLDKYRKIIGENDFKRLDDFLRQLGISSVPRVVNVGSSSWNGNGVSNNDKKVDGLEELLTQIDKKKSEVLWSVLTENWTIYEGSMKVLRRRYGPRGGDWGSEDYDTSACQKLRAEEWILNRAGDLVSAKVVTIQSLSDQYDRIRAGSKALIRFLDIHDDTANLSEEQKRKIRLADEIMQSGLSEVEIRAAIEDAKRKKDVQPLTDKNESKPNEGNGGIVDKVDAHPSPVLDRISDRIRKPRSSSPPSPGDTKDTERERTSDSEDSDSDGYNPDPVDYSKKIAQAEERHANEIAKLEREETLNKKAKEWPYSYGWFLALLELECMASSEKNADGKTISISFGKVEPDSQSSRTIVLKEPNRFIPQSIEEFSGVRVDLDFGNGRTGKLHVESFTAREFSLLGKLASVDELRGIDLGEVLEARIEVQNPSFLLQELLERFRELRLEEKLDMKANLTSNIEFVFGPPGTGKTTYLAEKILIPLMQGTEPTKVLVLAPTNKAADVLTTRIIEQMGTDTSYRNWLVRFGTSADERIEKAGVLRNRSFNIGALSHSVTVTTIARFAYDGFAVKYGSEKLHEMEWDVIVIDEASMISLSSIIYPLYRQKPRKFIIAGDPFQIEPIVAVERWKGENIYTLVGLNKAGAFANPATKPHDYLVTNLETQYRSIPAIGEIFSRFTYNGILKHHRPTGTQRPLKLNGLDVQLLNLIKFPVSKYESIYRAKRLESGTSYQTYSALFTFELVRWLAGQIQIDQTDNKFRIGVIAPYRAQANLLSRLNDSWAPKPIAVEIQVGTIHGFQGDECDIIIAVLNPPPTISSSPQMFLNKQNILNVAISRARDYLFIVMPDDKTEGLRNLQKIGDIEKLVKSGGAFVEYPSRIIEEMIWSNGNYLEENTFSTGHQMVNVYRKPERYYEVRSDDSAIDVQIHEKQ